MYDFEWNGKWYRPGNLFRVKVLGEFPEEAEGTLIPLAWVEQAQERWRDLVASGYKPTGILRLGSDVSGMGRDRSIHAHRYDNFVSQIEYPPMAAKTELIHMQTAGRIIEIMRGSKGMAFIDTIGEGAGVYSRIREQGYSWAYSAKASYGSAGLTDITGVRKFGNMRAYMYWAVRDALNPANKINLALPPDENLTQELTDILYTIDSSGRIIIEKKDDIKKRIGRSPDTADALALTYFPEWWTQSSSQTEQATGSIGIF